MNALKVVGKEFGDIRVALSGAGAAGVAIAKILKEEDVGDIVAVDRRGIISDARDFTDGSKIWMMENTNADGLTGDIHDALVGADVFIGVSAANLFEASEIAKMADDPIVFGLANPDPEFDPQLAREHAAVVATGRSDFANQINNVLAFPGVFRGALDAKAPSITDAMNVAAARAIASVVRDDLRHANYIIPSVFNSDVADQVTKAVKTATASPQ
jgi:malate dehydrogenase (oxaloacetate-decarboxylating)